MKTNSKIQSSQASRPPLKKTRTSFTVTYTLFCIPVVLLIASCIFISLSTTSCTREDAPTSNRNSLLSDLYNQSENYSIKKFLPINLSQYNLSPSSSFSSSQSSGTKSSGEYNLDDFTFSFDADSLLSDSGIRQRLFEDEDTIGLWAYT